MALGCSVKFPADDNQTIHVDEGPTSQPEALAHDFLTRIGFITVLALGFLKGFPLDFYFFGLHKGFVIKKPKLSIT